MLEPRQQTSRPIGLILISSAKEDVMRRLALTNIACSGSTMMSSLISDPSTNLSSFSINAFSSSSLKYGMPSTNTLVKSRPFETRNLAALAWITNSLSKPHLALGFTPKQYGRQTYDSGMIQIVGKLARVYSGRHPEFRAEGGARHTELLVKGNGADAELQ